MRGVWTAHHERGRAHRGGGPPRFKNERAAQRGSVPFLVFFRPAEAFGVDVSSAEGSGADL